MRAVEFTITGLQEMRRRERSDNRRGAGTLAVILIASLVLARHAQVAPEPAEAIPANGTDSSTDSDESEASDAAPTTVRALPRTSAFGEQALGTASAFKAFHIVNTEAQDIDAKATLSPASTTSFELKGTCGLLKPHESCRVSVRFRPQQVGEQSVQLVFATASGQTFSSTKLTGKGVRSEPKPAGAGLVASVTQLAFGPQPVGTSSAPPQEVKLSNRGGVDLVISYASLGDDEHQQFPLQLRCNNYYLPVGKDCVEGVQFRPKSEGPHAATFTIAGLIQPAGKSTGDLASFGVQGTGTAIHSRVNPSALTFNQEGKEQSPISVRSEGSAPLSISDVTVEGIDAARFGLDRADCLKGPIANGAQCRIMVSHQPDAKPSHSARVVITYHESSARDIVPLSWTPPPKAVLTAAPPSLTFGPGLPDRQTITVTNSGQGASRPLTATPVPTKGFSVPTNECTHAVSPGASCSIVVAYTPQNSQQLMREAAVGTPAHTPQDSTLYIVEGFLHQTITVALHSE